MDKKQSQRDLWNNIAEEWADFRDEPAKENIEFLKKQTGKILDLGSGSGRHLTKIKNGKMYLVDFSEKMIEFAREKAKSKKIDAEFFVSEIDNLPFEDNFFDSAICIAALHCVETHEARENVVQELHRVLKKGAQAKVVLWNKETKRFKNSQKDHYVGWRDKGKRYYYLYSPEEAYELFESNGFKIVWKEEPWRSIIFIVEKD